MSKRLGPFRIGWCLIAAWLGLFMATSILRAQAPLPHGLDRARWGMTAEELGEVTPVQKVDPNEPFSYADHMEEEPDIYASTSSDGRRIEYYFYDGELYKVYLIHSDLQKDLVLYNRMADELAGTYGPPARTYHEEVMGLMIIHTIWENESTVLDLRFGAGFVFQVHTDRVRSGAKERALKRKKSI
jgi:hypothetical protein